MNTVVPSPQPPGEGEQKGIMRLTSIRARLLIVYVGILVVGFVALTLIAGQQIASAARADFEKRLDNEIRLIAQGIRTAVMDQELTQESLSTLIEGYEAEAGGDLTLLIQDGPPGRPGGGYGAAPEIETAMRGEIISVERDKQLCTAAPVTNSQRQHVIVQLCVLLANLQALARERWASLFGLFGMITLLALTASALLARSIIRPLNALRESAERLAQGDFAHRVAYAGQDEIGAVARAFNEMARQVQSMLDEQRAFSSNTSHELRTPLTTIRLRSEALRDDLGLDAETTRQYVEEIDDEARRMGALIEDLTLLARFDAGRAEVGENQIDFGLFASGLRARMAAQTADKHLHIELTSPPDTPPVWASLNHVTVVFRNLLDNAIKYTPDGGRIDWRIRWDANGITSVIADSGRGIDADQLPHVFERFYRADKARSRDVPGSGLGLAIVRSIVEAYGGTVCIESAGAGQGTRVTVFWPYQPNADMTNGRQNE